MRRIFLHDNLDIDAVASAWAAERFIPGFKDATFAFRPADYDGHEMDEGDIAVDMTIGIKGKLDDDGTQHSSFASIIAQYAPLEDQAALHPLVTFIDAQDSYGSAIKHMVPDIDDDALNILSTVTVSSVLRALQNTNQRNDRSVLYKMLMIFDGLFGCGKARQEAEKEADQAELLADGQVAIVDNSRRYATNSILFNRGVRAIIYIDDYNLGVVRSSEEAFRADDPRICAVVEAAGEFDEWFAHSAGFLFCRGSGKSRQTSPSQVNPRDLAQALVDVVSTAA